MDYQIISSGSKGNAVIINKTILIDCGVAFKALREHYRDLQLVLMTHIHSDHFNRTTIKTLSRERPTLRWGVPEWLVLDVIGCGVDKANVDVYGMDCCYDYGVFRVSPFKLIHNVTNCGYRVFLGAERMMYATDTNSMNGLVAKGFDLYMLEANYSEADILERIREKQEAGQYCYEWEAIKNHLSKEKADNWLYQNMGANSQYVYLHQHEVKGAD